MKVIRLENCNRVVVSSDGYAIPPIKSHAEVMDVIFVREDGWMLGAPTQYADVARNMWADLWVRVPDL